MRKYFLDGIKLTSIRLIGSFSPTALSSNSEYSMYSATRCRKLNGSLRMIGIVILDNSLK
ncbi:unnamed protein product [Schistosoma mattheei]|uniref:Uncharacterized protein n=1 Tax=Schistosoma mattheei TaxID=31246 RepID=A0A183NXV8_9TREM|nr:unnamed protein product [Schistosoma mattheei]